MQDRWLLTGGHPAPRGPPQGVAKQHEVRREAAQRRDHMPVASGPLDVHLTVPLGVSLLEDAQMTVPFRPVARSAS